MCVITSHNTYLEATHEGGGLIHSINTIVPIHEEDLMKFLTCFYKSYFRLKNLNNQFFETKRLCKK